MLRVGVRVSSGGHVGMAHVKHGDPPVLNDEQVAAIAQVCHSANAAYCQTLGDFSQPPFSEAPAWQVESASDGVEAILSGRVTSPEQSHMNWCREKWAAGWRYGPTKDPEAKVHPCLAPYEDLPLEQRRKDALFFAIVRALVEPAEAKVWPPPEAASGVAEGEPSAPGDHTGPEI